MAKMISTAKWNTLTDDQRRILSEMGLKPAPPQRPSAKVLKLPLSKGLAPKPYTLRVHFRCLLCGTHRVVHYRMTPKENESSHGSYLKGRVTLAPGWDREVEENVSACKSCKGRLMKWEQVSLVNYCIKVAKFAAIGKVLYGKNKA